MSILDIIIFSLSGIIVFIYGFFTIKKGIKWKKTFKAYVDMGLSVLEAKELANKEVYPKKYAKKHKSNTNEQDDTIYEE